MPQRSEKKDGTIYSRDHEEWNKTKGEAEVRRRKAKATVTSGVMTSSWTLSKGLKEEKRKVETAVVHEAWSPMLKYGELPEGYCDAIYELVGPWKQKIAGLKQECYGSMFR